MPPAKRSTRSSRSSTFKEPAAVKRLNKSLDAAQTALSELSKQSGRDLGESARGVYKDLGTFITNARRHSGRLGKALARDFAQAQKTLAKTTTGSSIRRASTRSTSARSTSARSTSARRRSSRATSSAASKPSTRAKK